MIEMVTALTLTRATAGHDPVGRDVSLNLGRYWFESACLILVAGFDGLAILVIGPRGRHFGSHSEFDRIPFVPPAVD